MSTSKIIRRPQQNQRRLVINHLLPVPRIQEKKLSTPISPPGIPLVKPRGTAEPSTSGTKSSRGGAPLGTVPSQFAAVSKLTPSNVQPLDIPTSFSVGQLPKANTNDARLVGPEHPYHGTGIQNDYHLGDRPRYFPKKDANKQAEWDNQGRYNAEVRRYETESITTLSRGDLPNIVPQTPSNFYHPDWHRLPGAVPPLFASNDGRAFVLEVNPSMRGDLLPQGRLANYDNLNPTVSNKFFGSVVNKFGGQLANPAVGTPSAIVGGLVQFNAYGKESNTETAVFRPNSEVYSTGSVGKVAKLFVYFDQNGGGGVVETSALLGKSKPRDGHHTNYAQDLDRLQEEIANRGLTGAAGFTAYDLHSGLANKIWAGGLDNQDRWVLCAQRDGKLLFYYARSDMSLRDAVAAFRELVGRETRIAVLDGGGSAALSVKTVHNQYVIPVATSRQLPLFAPIY